MTTQTIVRCPYCQQPADLVNGATLDKTRSDLKERLFYRCEPCDARVGCHPGTGDPLGTLANQDLRKRRVQVHTKLDVIWKHFTKVDWLLRLLVYHWLALRMNRKLEHTHVGQFTEEDCRQALRHLNELHRGMQAAQMPEDIHD